MLQTHQSEESTVTPPVGWDRARLEVFRTEAWHRQTQIMCISPCQIRQLPVAAPATNLISLHHQRSLVVHSRVSW